MKLSYLGVIAFTFILVGSSHPVQKSKPADAGYNPTKAECVTKAQHADDVKWLSHRTASEINELDWQLSTCEGKFMPLKPDGAMLIAQAHGAVADEFRKRIEKAIGTLPPDLQKQIWDAFNTDSGESH